MNYSKEELHSLTQEVTVTLDGHKVDLCIQALITALVELIVSTAPSRAVVGMAIDHVHELIEPTAVQDLWTETNETHLH